MSNRHLFYENKKNKIEFFRFSSTLLVKDFDAYTDS